MTLNFYANAPISYPFLIDTYKNHQNVLQRDYLSAIVDLGVYTFLVKDPSHTYPEELVRGMMDLAKRDINNVLIASCDYPPIDFESNINVKYNNILKTIENWKRFSKLKKSNIIYTLQFSKLLDFKQVKDDIAKYSEPSSNYLGVGGLCRIMGSSKEKEYFMNVMRYIRQLYPNHHIHVWGASLWHINTLRLYANSFDNSKWTRPISKDLGNSSCKTKEERINYFEAYLDRIYPQKNTLMNYLEEIDEIDEIDEKIQEIEE